MALGRPEPPSRWLTKATPAKTKTGMEPHHLKMYSLLNMGFFFQCHVSFQGCTCWMKNFDMINPIFTKLTIFFRFFSMGDVENPGYSVWFRHFQWNLRFLWKVRAMAASVALLGHHDLCHIAWRCLLDGREDTKTGAATSGWIGCRFSWYTCLVVEKLMVGGLSLRPLFKYESIRV